MNILSKRLWQLSVITVSSLAINGIANGAPPLAPVKPPLPPLAMPAPPGIAASPAAAPAGNMDTTVTTRGAANRNNPFFQPLGNGRSCESCHQPGQGWSMTPQELQARFNASNGTDPVFRLTDGANSPNERTQTLEQRRVAYSLLLRRGVIRVGLPMPPVANFTLQQVDDPYGYASALELSLYRRPLPSTNLKFLSTVMWDARETQAAINSGNCLKVANPASCFAAIPGDLLAQAGNAVKGHAQFTGGLSSARLQAIVDFESSLITAATADAAAGSLNTQGATGGTAALAAAPYYFGINDFAAGDYKTGAPFNPMVFTLYNAWAPPFPGAPSPAGLTPAQAAVGRGQMLFNTRPMLISGVNGFNDVLNRPVVKGTCSSCHNTPNAGNASVPVLMNTGTAAAGLRTPDLPLYTLRNSATGAVIQTSDPGLGLQTGKWEDIGKFKVPGLRGLAAHAPYFHDGRAPDLAAVVAFYNRRFGLGLSPQEAADLTAFMRAL